MSDIIDINVGETIEEVTINVTDNLITVNINKVTGGGGEQTLAETLVLGNNTGGTDILLNNDDAIVLENNSSIRKGTYDFGQNGGVSRICGVDYEDMWQGGIRHVFDNNGLIRNSTNGFDTVPNFSFDASLRFKVGSFWTLDDGTTYICTDATIGAAVWELYNVIPTNTSDLTNDGEDGVNPFITAADIPSAVTSVGLTMPSAFSVTNSPITSSGDIAVTGAGTASQYVRGDGQLATFPSGGGGGSSVNYYLNGSIAASVATYQQMSNTAIIGAGTDFTLTGNGLIAQFLTDVGNPNRLEIPGGAWNFEMFFSMSSGGGSPKFYVELLKYDGAVFTSIASSSLVPETISGGTTIDLYLTSLAVPTTPLLVTDRLAIRVYIVDSTGGITATLHTENSHLCEIITTFSGGVTSLNGLTANTQYFDEGTTGTDFNISSTTDTHTFNLPTASASNRGALSSTDWSTFNNKQNALGFTAEDVANKQTDLTASATKYPTVNAVNTGLALKQNALGFTPYKFVQTSQTAHTGTTSETILATATINGGTFNSNDIMKMFFGVNKTGTGGGYLLRIKINTTNTLTGATQIALWSAASNSAQYAFITRNFSLNGGNLIGFAFTTSSLTDIINVGGAVSSTTYNTANTLYVFYTVALISSSDTISFNTFNIFS
jgi:hypothetical protein